MERKHMKRAFSAALLCAVCLTAVSPAEARDRGRIAAGLAGLAVGAGLVAAAHNGRDQWYRDNSVDPGYDDGFFRSRGYYPPDGYYADRYYDRGDCRTEDRFDSFTGRPIRVHACY